MCIKNNSVFFSSLFDIVCGGVIRQLTAVRKGPIIDYKEAEGGYKMGK